MNLSNELQTLRDEVEYWELVQALLAEQDTLEKQIIQLRLHINRLHVQLCYARKGNMETEIPYPEPASDIIQDFSGFAAMRKLQALE